MARTARVAWLHAAGLRAFKTFKGFVYVLVQQPARHTGPRTRTLGQNGAGSGFRWPGVCFASVCPFQIGKSFPQKHKNNETAGTRTA